MDNFKNSKSFKNSDGLSFLELHLQYKNGGKKLGGYISDKKEQRNKNIQDEVNIENASSLRNNIKDMEKELKKRVYHEFNSLDVEDIEKCGLTEHQKQIALLKQKYSNREIAKKLDIAQSNVSITFKRAVRKIIKYYKNKELSNLSPQERKVYKLHCEGKSRKEIANILETTPGSVKSRMHRIRKKLNQKGVPKTYKNNRGSKCV
ncbi:MAG: hypothetical protein FH753_15965 [Firmicutes bacterium]|nr:hypothetical protein [Bacillota bacterium]